MPKKIILTLLCFLFAFQMAGVVSAANVKSIQVSIDEQLLNLTQPPIQVNGTTMVPIAPIFKKLGMSLEKTGSSLRATKKGLTIHMTVGSKIANVNGVTVLLNEPVNIVNYTTMAPLRFISDSIGAGVTSADDIIALSNKKNKTLYDMNLPLLVSGNYVRNLTSTDYLELNIVDFYYNPKTKQVSSEDTSRIIDFKGNSTVQYNNYEIGKTTYYGGVYIGSAIKYLDPYSGDKTLSNENYTKVKAYYQSKAYLDKIRAFLQSAKDASAASLKKELQSNKNRPLKVTNVEITYNSIDIPEVNLTVKNLSAKTIVAYEMKVSCYDGFDRPVYRFLSSSNLFYGISQNNSLVSGDSITDTWTLNLYDLATQVKNVTITAVKFSDGTSWKL